MERPTELLAYRDGFAEHAHIRSRLVRGGVRPSQPLASILIPTYRRPRLLYEAVLSAISQQLEDPFEVVVVDNDSDPAVSAEVDAVITKLNAPNLWLYRNDRNLGMFGNWNRCLQLSRGRWVTILSDDDLLAPDFLAASLAALAGDPAIRLISCRVIVMEEPGSALPPRPLVRRIGRRLKDTFTRDRSGPARRMRLEDYFLANPHSGSLGILMDREAAVEMGGFSAALFPSADYVFFARFQMTHGTYRLRRGLASYRIAVNESLNPALLRGWLHQGLQLRGEMASHLRFSPILLDLYAWLHAIEFARTYGKQWSSHTDVDAVLKEVNLPNIPVYALAHGLRIVLGSLLSVGGERSQRSRRWRR